MHYYHVNAVRAFIYAQNCKFVIIGDKFAVFLYAVNSMRKTMLKRVEFGMQKILYRILPILFVHIAQI